MEHLGNRPRNRSASLIEMDKKIAEQQAHLFCIAWFLMFILPHAMVTLQPEFLKSDWTITWKNTFLEI